VSWDDAVWLVEPVDVATRLPVPSRWRRWDHEDFTCWEFDGERWLIHVCDWQPVEDLAEVPDRVRQLLPKVSYLISIGMEPINPSRAAWAFLNRVITALAIGGHGLGFDVFTDEPIR
jgi:hypothetical protein